VTPFLAELAQRYGTPFYAYDLARVRQQAEALHSLLPAVVRPTVLYSLKSNPLPSIVRELIAAGCMVDLTSEGETLAAVEAGFDPRRALFGGPGKTAPEIAMALEHGVRSFSIESWHDLAVLAAVARRLEVKVRGLFRVNPAEPPRARVAMSGVASQFGFEEAELVAGAAAGLGDSADVVSIEGVHIYWGTQIEGADALAAAFASAIDTAERVSLATGTPLNVLNLGGGFPWPYAHRGDGADLSSLRAQLLSLHARARHARDAEWWFESGRYLSAPSGTLVTRVVDVKVSKGGRQFVILDAGIHHLGGLSGLGRIPRFSVDVDAPPGREGTMTADLVGQLCTPLDCIGRNLTLPRLEAGDVVSIPNVGAYGLTASLTAFLSRPAPLEIAHRGASVVEIHRLRGGHERWSV
jgi:diaminopimelate decarboxylase